MFAQIQIKFIATIYHQLHNMREEGAAELRHDNFMVKVVKVLSEKDALKFKGCYASKIYTDI